MWHYFYVPGDFHYQLSIKENEAFWQEELTFITSDNHNLYYKICQVYTYDYDSYLILCSKSEATISVILLTRIRFIIMNIILLYLCYIDFFYVMGYSWFIIRSLL